MKTIITYGTYDTLHFGHIHLLERARALGDRLIVGLSTDAFNAAKGKRSHFDFDTRRRYLQAIRYVDLVIPEASWDQKEVDIRTHGADVFVMGDDWRGKFDDLAAVCEVHYLDRTPAISSTLIKANVINPGAQSA